MADTKTPDFTPGPWCVEAPHPSKGLVFIRSAGCDPVVGEIIVSLVSRPNAHLIAAAPDLYAALDALHAECEAMRGPELRDDPVWGVLMRSARFALAKARGEG